MMMDDGADPFGLTTPRLALVSDPVGVPTPQLSQAQQQKVDKELEELKKTLHVNGVGSGAGSSTADRKSKKGQKRKRGGDAGSKKNKKKQKNDDDEGSQEESDEDAPNGAAENNDEDDEGNPSKAQKHQGDTVTQNGKPKKRRGTSNRGSSGTRTNNTKVERWEIKGNELGPGTEILRIDEKTNTPYVFAVLTKGPPQQIAPELIDLEQTDVKKQGKQTQQGMYCIDRKKIKQLIDQEKIGKQHLCLLTQVDKHGKLQPHWYEPFAFWQYECLYEVPVAIAHMLIEARHSERWTKEIECGNRGPDGPVHEIQLEWCEYAHIDRFHEPVNVRDKDGIRAIRRLKELERKRENAIQKAATVALGTNEAKGTAGTDDDNPSSAMDIDSTGKDRFAKLLEHARAIQKHAEEMQKLF